MTQNNSVSVADAYITNLPDALKPVQTILALNHSDFQALQLGLRNQNLFHFDPVTLANGQMMIQIPFTNVMAVSTEIGSGKAVLTNPDNFLYGTDLLSDITSPVSWYSLDFQQVRLKLAAKMGAAVAFGSQVVYAS
jgi:hypothetical protein